MSYTRLNHWGVSKESNNKYTFVTGNDYSQSGIDRISLYLNYKSGHAQISMRIYNFNTYLGVLNAGVEYATLAKKDKFSKASNRYYFDSNYTSFEQYGYGLVLGMNDCVRMAVQEAGLSSYGECHDLETCREYVNGTLRVLETVDKNVAEIIEYINKDLFEKAVQKSPEVLVGNNLVFWKSNSKQTISDKDDAADCKSVS